MTSRGTRRDRTGGVTGLRLEILFCVTEDQTKVVILRGRVTPSPSSLSSPVDRRMRRQTRSKVVTDSPPRIRRWMAGTGVEEVRRPTPPSEVRALDVGDWTDGDSARDRTVNKTSRTNSHDQRGPPVVDYVGLSGTK